MTKKTILKQKQTQKVVVNINQPVRRRRQPKRRQTKQQQQQQQQIINRPQVIPIPYPIIQPPQTPFNRPSVDIPSQNQKFETNFKNLSDQVNNLSNRFNSYGDAFINFMKSSNDVIPSDSLKVKMEEATPPMDKPTPPLEPIIYPKESIKVTTNDDMFIKPKVTTDTSTIFNKPLMIENAKPSPLETKFEDEQKVEEENIIEPSKDNEEELKPLDKKLISCPICGEKHYRPNLKRHINTNHLDNNLEAEQTGTSYNNTTKKNYKTYSKEYLTNKYKINLTEKKNKVKSI